MKNHSVALPAAASPVHNFDPELLPYWQVDYYRFTKYGLIYLFKDFQIVSLKESNGYGGSLFQFCNYFLSSFRLGNLFTPIYLINNILGLFIDKVFSGLSQLPGTFWYKLHHYIYTSLTINYILIVKNKN